jgi:hypothetical protein
VSERAAGRTARLAAPCCALHCTTWFFTQQYQLCTPCCTHDCAVDNNVRKAARWLTMANELAVPPCALSCLVLCPLAYCLCCCLCGSKHLSSISCLLPVTCLPVSGAAVLLPAATAPQWRRCRSGSAHLAGFLTRRLLLVQPAACCLMPVSCAAAACSYVLHVASYLLPAVLLCWLQLPHLSGGGACERVHHPTGPGAAAAGGQRHHTGRLGRAGEAGVLALWNLPLQLLRCRIPSLRTPGWARHACHSGQGHVLRNSALATLKLYRSCMASHRRVAAHAPVATFCMGPGSSPCTLRATNAAAASKQDMHVGSGSAVNSLMHCCCCCCDALSAACRFTCLRRLRRRWLTLTASAVRCWTCAHCCPGTCRCAGGRLLCPTTTMLRTF